MHNITFFNAPVVNRLIKNLKLDIDPNEKVKLKVKSLELRYFSYKNRKLLAIKFHLIQNENKIGFFVFLTKMLPTHHGEFSKLGSYLKGFDM